MCYSIHNQIVDERMRRSVRCKTPSPTMLVTIPANPIAMSGIMHKVAMTIHRGDSVVRPQSQYAPTSNHTPT